ncbi:hypothetical protein E3N88_23148 [Mikania micrantha]|uniref:Uncharacterized protein n=1 Tax=Mikania micrantha TaxID=192012 RepID=A0A5N6NE80_9ASTR|nr:hypothetical protein E3N88_23148 [Mikania micrantha]
MDPSNFNDVLEHPPEFNRKQNYDGDQNKKVDKKLAINLKSKKNKDTTLTCLRGKGSTSFVELDVAQFQDELSKLKLDDLTSAPTPHQIDDMRRNGTEQVVLGLHRVDNGVVVGMSAQHYPEESDLEGYEVEDQVPNEAGGPMHQNQNTVGMPVQQRENEGRKQATDGDGFKVVKNRKESNMGKGLNSQQGKKRTMTGIDKQGSHKDNTSGSSMPYSSSEPQILRKMGELHSRGSEGRDVDHSVRKARPLKDDRRSKIGRNGKDSSKKAHDRIIRSVTRKSRQQEEDELMPVDILNGDKRAIYNRLKEFQSVRAVDQAKWVQGEWE